MASHCLFLLTETVLIKVNCHSQRHFTIYQTYFARKTRKPCPKPWIIGDKSLILQAKLAKYAIRVMNHVQYRFWGICLQELFQSLACLQFVFYTKTSACDALH